MRLDPNFELDRQIDASEWEIQEVNNSGTFFKNPITEQLDQDFGDIMAEIRDIEEKIIHEVSQLVIER